LQNRTGGRKLPGKAYAAFTMIGARLTWVVVGAVAALLAVAGVDALRSSGHDTSASTTTPDADRRLPRCTAQEIAISIDVLGGQAALVLRDAGGRPCQLPSFQVRLTVEDRAGHRLSPEASPHLPPVGGRLSPGIEQTTNFPEYIPDCHTRGPFLGIATVGPYSARRTVSGRAIGCLSGA
jgi:hypothetical protein